MNKRTRTILIIAGLALAAYLVYRYYKNRGSTTGSGLGANLNSAAPELVAGSSGPASGLNYYAGSTNVNLTLPVTNQKATTSATGGSDHDKKPPPKHRPPKHKHGGGPVFPPITHPPVIHPPGGGGVRPPRPIVQPILRRKAA